MKWSLGPAPTQLISGFSLDPTWLIRPRKLPRRSRNGNHFSISGSISPPSESGGSITCGPTETIPSCGSSAVATPVVWAFTYVFSLLQFLAKGTAIERIRGNRTKRKESSGNKPKPPTVTFPVSLHTCMCTYKALSHKEDHITPTAPCPAFLN